MYNYQLSAPSHVLTGVNLHKLLSAAVKEDRNKPAAHGELSASVLHVNASDARDHSLTGRGQG